MTHDETAFPDPHTFNPERFLEEGYDQDDRSKDPYSIVFGFGKRSVCRMHVRFTWAPHGKFRKCPGARFATSAIWIAMATSLATLDISASVGPDGRKKSPTLECEDGAMVFVTFLCLKNGIHRLLQTAKSSLMTTNLKCETRRLETY